MGRIDMGKKQKRPGKEVIKPDRNERKRPGDALPERILEAIRHEAEACFRNARGSHSWDHTQRVYQLCLRIGRKEGADLEILKLAALLHDIGREAEDRTDGRVCHARESAERARRILTINGIDKKRMTAVVRCIETHRFRGRDLPDSLEGKVLFDADKLDSIGAVGIGRAFLFAGEVGARLHDPKIQVDQTQPYSQEDSAYREFLVKLSKIKDRIFTREGRRIARDRHRFMTEYFKRLNRETAGRI
ncbi:MAG: HD domain-containing protein [Candidatus Aminicenantes bacterium]|nr:HD domain-containing protein [Candidatus Aminicenantes bacterium]